MRALTLLCLLCAAAATGGNASAPARRLTWAAGLDGDEERLPGWQGEQSRDGSAPHRHESKGDQYAREDRERGTWMELISWRPRAYIIHNFMSPEECVELVKIARPFMARSTVVDSVTGESKVDPIRTRCACATQDAPYEAALPPLCARASAQRGPARRAATRAARLTATRAAAAALACASRAPDLGWAPTASRRSSAAGSTRWSPK